MFPGSLWLQTGDSGVLSPLSPRGSPMCPLPFRSRRCAKSPGGSGPTGDSRFHAAEPGLQLQGHLQKAVPTSQHEKVTHLFFKVSHISENRGPLGYCAPRPPESAGGRLTGAGRTGSAEPRAVGRRENWVLGPPVRACCAGLGRPLFLPP